MSQETTKSEAADPDPLVGRLVAGKYHVVRRVARGGMSRVYLAIQQPLNRQVALKVMEAAPGADPIAFRERFLREASTCAKLRHPNTVTVFDYGVFEAEGDGPSGGSLYMVMEFVEGRNLAQELRGGAFRVDRAARIAFEVCRSLQEAHELGIVHRDLKTSNIMLATTSEGEQVKVVDFGIARGVDDVAEADFVGTPRYMAPELILRERVDGRADLYSLGIVLFEALTGKPPFRGDNHQKTMLAQLKTEAPPLEESAPEPVPESLSRLVASLLSKDPARRPPSAAAVRRSLHGILLELRGDQGDLLAVPTGLAPAVTLTTPATLSRTEYPSQTSRPAPVAPRLALMLLASASLLLLVTMAAIVVVAIALYQHSATVPPGPVSAPAAAAPTQVTLTLGSDPAGAEVWENGSPIGYTRLAVPLATDPLSPDRIFELRLEGHEPTTVIQRASTAPVQLEVELVPLVAEPVPSPAPEPAAVAPPSTPRPTVEPAEADRPRRPVLLER